MKITIVIISLLSLTLVGCDKETLDGLNININADIKSDYNKEEVTTDNQSNPDSTENVVGTPSNQISNNNSTANNSDPDAPLPFRPISDCSPSGITMKTNETFYAGRGQVKSIDSKNEQELKAWREMYAKFEAECKK